MGKIALYRHYRSHDFSDLVGQNHVSVTLEQAIKADRISHAYLFTGPKGVGKTSAARILARRVNEIEETAHHPDIIEIDAASNNGVDEIRELREKVHIAPNYAKYKVYIIDEVHMLSTAAFNALLKTLEEPPSHVIFVLATTEPHKLPQTIISRTQHFPFRPISHSATQKHLKSIAKQEKIKISDEALSLLATLGEGSMRDSISLLDQVSTSATSEITVTQIEDMIGLARTEQIASLITAVEAQDNAAMLKVYDELLESGIAPQLLMKQLLSYVRRQIRERIQAKQPLAVLRSLLEQLSSLPPHTVNIEFALEALLLEAGSNPTDRVGPAPAKNFRARIVKAKPKSVETAKPSEPSLDPTATTTDSTQLDQTAWIEALSLIKQRHGALYALLSNTDVTFSVDSCEISARFQFHYRRLNEQRTQASIADALKSVCGRDITVKIKSDAAAKAKQPPPEPEAEQEDFDVISQVTNILGGEVAHG
ncbi:MAG: DNA polymerase III subunit gamma/tau [Candidatus Saccharimonadales bacterium]